MKLRIEEAIKDKDCVAIVQEEDGQIFLCVYGDKTTIEIGITSKVLANIGNGLIDLLNSVRNN